MKKWVKRLLVIKVIFFLISSGFWLLNNYQQEKTRLQALHEAQISAIQQGREAVYRFEQQLNGRNTLEDLQLLEKTIGQLPPNDQARLQPYLDLALASYYFDRAEDNIRSAQSIFSVTKETNPIIAKYVKEAIADYQEAKKKIDTMETLLENPDYNFYFLYARGNIYYRYLALIADKSEARDVFNQTVLSWREALAYREKDIDTEINLEILSKNQGQLLQNANQGTGERVKILPQQGVGLGKPRGVH